MVTFAFHYMLDYNTKIVYATIFVIHNQQIFIVSFSTLHRFLKTGSSIFGSHRFP